MGFTPINPPSAHALGIKSAPPLGPIAPTPGTVQLAVSAYLGRGDSDATAPLSQALHGPGTKKSGPVTRGAKKRASTTQASTQSSKRRKSSNLHNDLTITKSAGKINNANGRTHDSTLVVPDERSGSEVAREAAEVEGGEKGSAVAVFAPPTSMDALQGLQVPVQRTSVEVAKGAGSRRKTLYRSAPTRGREVEEVSFAQPLLEQRNTASGTRGTRSRAPVGVSAKGGGDVPAALELRSTAPGTTITKAIPQPQTKAQRKQTVILTEDDFTDDFTDDSIDDADPLALIDDLDATKRTTLRHQKQTVAGTKGTSQQTTAAATIQKHLQPFVDEYDDSDLEDTDLLALANRIKSKVMPAPRYGPFRGTEIASSDANKIPEKFRKLPKHKRVKTLILTPDDAFIISDDEEELPGSVDPTTGRPESPAPPTPPPRDRKLNIHEDTTDEDYNGALLTPDEVAFLAKMKSTQREHQPTAPSSELPSRPRSSTAPRSTESHLLQSCEPASVSARL